MKRRTRVKRLLPMSMEEKKMVTMLPRLVMEKKKARMKAWTRVKSYPPRTEKEPNQGRILITMR